MYYGGFVLGNSGRELSYVDISKDPELSVWYVGSSTCFGLSIGLLNIGKGEKYFDI